MIPGSTKCKRTADAAVVEEPFPDDFITVETENIVFSN